MRIASVWRKERLWSWRANDMKPLCMNIAALALGAFFIGCGSGGGTSQPGAAASVPPSGTTAGSGGRAKKTGLTPTEQRTLGPDEVRVALLVLPGDAAVEVDK